jgi:hypothetical protein
MSLAVELANLPDGIRGYGHVKENNLKGVRVKWHELLVKWRAPQGSAGTARAMAVEMPVRQACIHVGTPQRRG